MPRPFGPGTLLAPLLAGCPAPQGDDSAPPPDSGEPPAGIEAEPALYVEDGPADLDLASDGRVLIGTRGGGDVLAWRPGEKSYDVLENGISGLQGIAVAEGDRLWAATSDGGIVGAVGWIEDGELVPLASQADDGTLMRYLRDVAVAPDGQLLTVDGTVGALFRTDPASGATALIPLEIASPRALLVSAGELWVAGSDGVYRVAYPSGAVERIDARGAWGLCAAGAALLASAAEEKVFAVGGASLGGEAIGLPGALRLQGETLWVSDLAGPNLYALDLTGWEP